MESDSDKMSFMEEDNEPKITRVTDCAESSMVASTAPLARIVPMAVYPEVRMKVEPLPLKVVTKVQLAPMPPMIEHTEVPVRIDTEPCKIATRAPLAYMPPMIDHTEVRKSHPTK